MRFEMQFSYLSAYILLFTANLDLANELELDSKSEKKNYEQFGINERVCVFILHVYILRSILNEKLYVLTPLYYLVSIAHLNVSCIFFYLNGNTHVRMPG